MRLNPLNGNLQMKEANLSFLYLSFMSLKKIFPFDNREQKSKIKPNLVKTNHSLLYGLMLAQNTSAASNPWLRTILAIKAFRYTVFTQEQNYCQQKYQKFLPQSLFSTQDRTVTTISFKQQ